MCLGPRGLKSPAPSTPPPHHHHSVSTISAFTLFTFHALLPILRPYPASLTAAVASAVVADLPSPTPCLSAHRVFAVSLGAYERAALFPPPADPCQVAPPSSEPALDVSDILLFEEINPTFQQSRRRLPQSDVHVEKKLRNQLRFGLFYKLNERSCALTVSTSLLCSYSRPHSTCYGIP